MKSYGKETVFWCLAICLCVVALALSLTGIYKPEALVRFLMQVASVFSQDRQLAANQIQNVELVVRTGAVPMFILFSLVVLYLTTGIFLWKKLPDTLDTKAAAPVAPVSKLEFISFLCICLIALIPRLHAMNKGFYFDEINSILQFIDVPISKTISSLGKFENHIAYSILARLSRHMLGRQEWALRLPALLLGMVTFLPLWLFGRRLVGRNAALIGTFCLAILPPHVVYCSMARGYSGLVLFTLLSTMVFLKLLESPSRNRLLLYVFVSVLAIYFHMFGAMAAVGQILFVLYLSCQQLLSKDTGVLDRFRFRYLWISGAAIGCISLLLYAPVMYQLTYVMSARGRRPFEPSFPLRMMGTLLGPVPLFLFFFLVVGIGLFRLFRNRKLEAQYLLVLSAVPFLGVWLTSPFDMQPRFFSFALPYLLLLFASGLYHLVRVEGTVPLVRRALSATALICGVLLMLVWCRKSWEGWPQFGFREAVEALRQDENPHATYCAIGDDPRLYQYYSKFPMLFVRTRQEVELAVSKNNGLRCVGLDFPWKKVNPEIMDFFSKNGEIKKYYKSYVFIYSGKESQSTSPPESAQTFSQR